MSDRGIFPSKLADLNNYIATVEPYLIANAVRLGVSSANQSSLTLLYTNPNVPPNTLPDTLGWKELWVLYVNPATRLKTITDLVQLRKEAIKALLRTIYNDIPESKLTPTDRATLNLAVHSDSHTPAPVPANAPDITIDSNEHLSVTLKITDPANPHTQQKPEGVSHIELEHAFQSLDDMKQAAADAAVSAAARKADPSLPDAEPVPEFPQESDFHHLADTGKFLYTTGYTLDQVNGAEYIRGRYVNTRKIPGAWSQIIKVIIG